MVNSLPIDMFANALVYSQSIQKYFLVYYFAFQAANISCFYGICKVVSSFNYLLLHHLPDEVVVQTQEICLQL